MHRQSGRYPISDYYVELECLPENELFTPSDITRRKYNRKSDHESFQKMFHAIYQFGTRNGLALNPDNCIRRAGGKPFMENGRAKLMPGERRAKWYGKTWKSKLYIEDRLALKKFVAAKLVNVLTQIKEAKMEDHRKPELTDLQELVVQQTEIPKTVNKFTIWKVALLAAIVLTAGGLYNYSYLNEGFQILRSDGAQSAIEFFQNRGESYDNIFGQAWASYRNGDYEEAEKLSHKVLASRAANDQARASYLLGELKTIGGEYEQAKEHFLTAHAIYQSLGKLESQYRTQLGLTKLYLSQRDIQNASYYLNLSEQNEKAWEDEYFLYFKSQIAFSEGDYETALSLSLNREKLVNGDNSRLSGIYSDIGLYYGFIGNLEECLSYTIKAQGIASEQENKKSLMHNNLNMCLYLKCSMQDYSQLRETVLMYARSKKDMKLMEMMYFIDKFTCPLSQGDPGDLPPPDDPPPGNLLVPQFNGNPNVDPGVPHKRSDPGHLPPPSGAANTPGDSPTNPPEGGQGN